MRERKHERECKVRLAFTSAAAIECEHGYDACPICDPCTCAEIRAGKQKPLKRPKFKRTTPATWRP